MDSEVHVSKENGKEADLSKQVFTVEPKGGRWIVWLPKGGFGLFPSREDAILSALQAVDLKVDTAIEIIRSNGSVEITIRLPAARKY
jgi:hypothetical protein